MPMNIDDYKQDILIDMNNCGSTCSDIEHVCLERGVEKGTEWLVEHLPALRYTVERMLNYIFSNGVAAGSQDENNRLDRWMYEGKNKTGATNYSVLREAIGQATVYGECGLRIIDGALYTYKTGYYGILYKQERGYKEVVAYYIREDEERVDKELQKDDWDKFREYRDVYQWFSDQHLILLDPTEFVNLRNTTAELHGRSPFEYDKLRVDLLLSVYERLNYDIRYDGPGRIIVRPKAGFVSDEDNETSTSTVIENTNSVAQEKRYKDAMAEVRRVSTEIKNSSSDSVIALSNGFEKEIEHLPRVTKATEFFGWIDEEGTIIAQLLGMSPVLMETGKWSGNVSMAAIIDNAMLNTIVPMREMFAIQFSQMIATEVGVEKVYFNKYELKQVADENDARMKLSQAIMNLSYASKANPNGKIEEVINGLAEVLGTSTHDDYGNLRTLS